MEEMIARLLKITQGVDPGVVMSLDVTGWSPEAFRELFLRHHDIVLSYFQKFLACTVKTCGTTSS